jgi:alpha-tubulin suppressor-like RCC1 family protein
LVGGGYAFSSLGAGGFVTCGLTPAGKAYCWGPNYDGEVGDGTTTARNTPTAVSGGLTFTALAVGGEHVCGLISTGAAYCWGWNGQGQVGDGTFNNSRLVPTAVAGGITFTAISAAGEHTCGLTSAGPYHTYCWGNNDNGELGIGTTDAHSSPVPVGGGFTFTRIAAAGRHTCALTSAGATYCWGENRNGQLGDGTTTEQWTPKAVAVGLTFAALGGGAQFTCGLTSAGKAYCWGDNNYGQLGDGTTTQQWFPVAVLMP